MESGINSALNGASPCLFVWCCSTGVGRRILEIDLMKFLCRSSTGDSHYAQNRCSTLVITKKGHTKEGLKCHFIPKRHGVFLFPLPHKHELFLK